MLLVRVDRLERSLRPRLTELLKAHLEQETKSKTRPKQRVRILSTSTVHPGTLVRERDFPQELADILGERIIRLPTLRERVEDVPLFVNHFLMEAAEEFDREIIGVDDKAMERLVSYPWPGNVKELKILMEHVVMTAPGPLVTVNDLLIPGKTEDQRTESFSRTVIEVTDFEVTQQEQAQTSRSGWICSLEGTDIAGPFVESPLRRQKTLRGKVVMYGHGLHSGTKTGLTLSPLPPCAGILFGHITSEGTVPAILSNVKSTEFSTSLKSNGSPARTIEHLMAVFHVYGLTNVLVKISGEVPIMDGSALEFCRMVESAEI
ncbi:MAG: UDP-3-O-acyl-N-acetylglucosamine deacetylase, partial [Deltaproteobacteria bacterium]|nr:UDP-3-O-acyl-N-acetylglucosamine deacetylase [Deltaproteobacteria bacterium]